MSPSLLRAGGLVAPLLLALLGSAPASAGPRQGPSGSWKLLTDEAALAAEVDAAIDRTVTELPALFRPLARPSLRKAAVPCEALVLELDGDRLSRRCDDEAPFLRRLDNSDPPIEGSDGHAYRTTVTTGPDWVSLRFDGKRGGQTEHYLRNADGTLTATMTVHSRYLEVPLTWTLSYASTGPSGG